MFINGIPFSMVQLPDDLPEMDRSGMNHTQRIKDKHGAICSDLVNQVAFVSKKMEGNRYLEIGTFDGVILSILAQMFPDREFHAIDNFCDGENTGAGCLKHFIRNNEGLDNVFLYTGTSSEILPFLNGLFDMVFIDGDHSYEWVMQDYKNIAPFVRDGGIISFHDSNMKGVRKALLELFNGRFEMFGEVFYVRKNG